MHLVLCLVLVLGGLQLTCCSLLVGAWNIERFGPSKLLRPTVMRNIATIVSRYDIILIQELQDTKPGLPVINNLMHRLNQLGQQYDYVVSAPLGPSTYKEEYLFVYRSDRVTVGRRGQYEDNPNPFTRPPYIVEFSDIAVGGVGNFVLIPQHTSPLRAVQEIDALVDVVTTVKRLWAIHNMLILGDFNAGCTYVKQRDWRNIRLFTNNDFDWLIPNTADTTVARHNCAYDRIVTTTSMRQHVLANSADFFNFGPPLGLSVTQALHVSNHFPVEVVLR